MGLLTKTIYLLLFTPASICAFNHALAYNMKSVVLFDYLF